MEGRRSGVVIVLLDAGRAHVVGVVIETGVLARKLIRGDCRRKERFKCFKMLDFFVLTAGAVQLVITLGNVIVFYGTVVNLI